MQELKKNFTQLVVSLVVVMCGLIVLSMVLAQKIQAAEASDDSHILDVPVSINALMVTLVDHSAHYIWDYGAMERKISADEWRTVEYYAIQLAGAGSLITVGGSGVLDDTWVKAEGWKTFSRDMSQAGLVALQAAKDQNKAALMQAGDLLVDSCQACHDMFKPEIPTEGIMHQPDYDYLYHLFR